MRPIARIKITVGKISKPHMFVGKKGTYLDVAMMPNATGRDEYGNDGFLIQEVTKEAREAGEKGPIIGNWKYLDEPKAAPPARQQPAQKPKPPADPNLDVDPDDIF